MAGVPKIQLPKTKLDKLADDLAALSTKSAANVGGTAVPSFQRHGYMEKLGHTRNKWFKRFFVLRDSFLLSYNLQKSDYTVEPRSAAHLGNATIQLMEHDKDRKYCFLLTTQQKDRFLFSCESESDRQAWVRDLETARRVTHANMVKLAVENRCLAEEKGAADVAINQTGSALALFSNTEYVQNTPITGGAEGWLRTTGFNPEEQAKEKNGVLGMKKKQIVPTKLYFILRDSHILMFNGGDMLTKPRGVMYLLSTSIDVDPEMDKEGEYHFKIRSPEFGDEIDLIASTQKIRKRWMDALLVGSRVTYPDFCMLKQEHAILASVTMTPRAAPPPKANAPAPQITSNPPEPLMFEDFDIQGEQLDPGTQQAYDGLGNPLLRAPDGKLVNVEGEAVAAATPRFGAAGEQLDPFNRALPPGAVPMFTAEGAPIGVGPDGQHYLPDGTVIDKQEPHFDVEGKELGKDTVDAADAVATNLSVAIKVRGALKADGAKEEAVDVLGRTFRDMNGAKAGVLLNADGQEVPLASARVIQNKSGQLTDYKEEEKEEESHHLEIKTTNDEGDEVVLGKLEVTGTQTLKDVRNFIVRELETQFETFVFLFNGIALLKYEEGDKLAATCLPEIFVRGTELKAVKAKVFTAKVQRIQDEEKKAADQENEFANILAKVRQGKFLRNTHQALLDP